VGADWWVPRLEKLADLVTVYREDLFQSEGDLALIESHGRALAVSSWDDIVDLTLSAMRDLPLAGVVTFGEPLLWHAAVLAETLGLPHHSTHAVERMQQKDKQRAVLRRAGIPGPRYAVISAVEDVPKAVATMDFPAVLKPVTGHSSSSTVFVVDAQSVAACYDEARRLRATDWRFADAPDRFILEEFVVGRQWHPDSRMGQMVSVESLVCAGQVTHLMVTDKFPPATPFRETGDLMPSWLSVTQRHEIESVTTAAIRAMEASHGALHTELKLTRNGPTVIEVNGRLGGYIARSLETVCNYDVVTEIGRLALGASPCPPLDPKGYVACLNLMAPATDDIVSSLTGGSEVAALPGVTHVEIDATGTVPAWRLGGGCYGLVELVADNPQELLDLRDRILAILRFEITGRPQQIKAQLVPGARRHR
jgi:biotin carboxylase